MKININDMVGKRYGRWTVLEIVKDNTNRNACLCRCDCGTIRVVKKYALTSGHSVSCDCYRKEQAKKKTEERIHTDLIGKVGEHYTVLKYVKDNKWLCKCDCGKEFLAPRYGIISGSTKSCGCHSFDSIHTDITGNRFGRLVAIKYIGGSKWECKCDCGNVTNVLLNDLRRGSTRSCGCYQHDVAPEMNRLLWLRKRKPYPQEFIDELYYESDKQKAKERLLTKKDKVYFNCSIHGKYLQQVSEHLRIKNKGRSNCCPRCEKGFSNEEQEIREFLQTITNYSIDKTRDKLDGKEIDMYIDELNLGIEYNGSVFHASLNGAFDDKPKYYHRDKFLCAKENGIHLINIFDVDWDNNQDKIKMYLKSLVVSNKKLYARKCEINLVTKQVADDFTDMYHIQGRARQNTINYGLYCNDELYAVMSFGKLRLSKTGDGQYEIHRYCVKDGYTIVGGANKLLKAFEREYNPTYIRSYSDNDYFIGNIYERLGFKDSGQCTPRYYWYYHNNEIKRERCMLKHLKVEYPELLQEAYDNEASNKEDYVMIKLGASKVYRSGNTKWEKTY